MNGFPSDLVDLKRGVKTVLSVIRSPVCVSLAVELSSCSIRAHTGWTDYTEIPLCSIQHVEERSSLNVG